MKKFKTESKKILDMMINSIYTHKEIFIRELLSNASDAIDKLYYKSLTEGISGLSREDFQIKIEANKDAKTLVISDNGIGMDEKELDENLGIIARSGSQLFKNEEMKENKEDIDIIGQFGVGFYSAFMVANTVEVISKKYGEEKAYKWTSNGSDGYDIQEATRDGNGTTIILHLRDDSEDEKYSQYLEEYTIRELVKKYSDYIKYPIIMDVTKYSEEENKEPEKEQQTLNTMVPLWKKNKKDIKEEEYNSFYMENFYDYEKPARVIHTSVEGKVDYTALIFIPSKPRYDYYTKNFKKGLKLYTNGVLITDNNEELLPDYFNFAKGLVDSQLTLNVSRETIQHNSQLKFISNNIEKKIKADLLNFLETDREGYIKFYEGFSRQLKYGCYDNFGAAKETLQDLLLFHSIKQDKLITFKEYVAAMGESQKEIYYATGATVEAIKNLPLSEKVLDDGIDILCLTDEVDEFLVKVIGTYDNKTFKSITNYDSDKVDLITENKELTNKIKEILGDKVAEVKITSRLKSHPVSLSARGELSIEMEKVLNKSPELNNQVKSEKVLEINANHAIYNKLCDMLKTDEDKFTKAVKVLYSQALLIEGLNIDNPTELADMICDLI